MTKYEQPLTVTLTVGEWLSVQCCLSDARNWNEHQGWHALAKDTRALKATLGEQVDAAIDAADAENAARIAEEYARINTAAA